MKLDLKELLAKITGQTEFKTLLWTNTTGSSFNAQTISLDLSKYDHVEVWFYSRIGTVDAMAPNPLEIPLNERREIIHLHSLGVGGPNENIGMRGVTVSATDISFGDYYYKNRRTGDGLTMANQFAVPYKVYGIRYVGGVLLNSILKAFSHLRIGGGVDEGRYKGIGGETVRLFLQTCHKRKLDIQRISERLSRSVVLWLEHTLFGRKHRHSLATHSAEDYCFEWGRDNKWNCARTIGKSLGFIFKECLHNFQRIGDNIGQTWSVCGLYESVTISGRGWAV